MKPSPYLNLCRIEFVVTYHCTGRCLHCSVGEQLGSCPDGCHHVKAREAAETVKKLAEIFPITSVMTFGGEPLLYPEVTCRIHQMAKECGIALRQVITNGYFSKDEQRVRQVAELLHDSGVNDLMLSVDAFHQQRIPLEAVRAFASQVKQAGMTGLYLHPAWLVDEQHQNPYNQKTREILDGMQKLEIPVSGGNNIFLSGNAAKYLSSYYDRPALSLTAPCGSIPYTEPLDRITALSILPNGDAAVCGFVIGNIYREEIEQIVTRYSPYGHPYLRAILTGGVSALADLAAKQGIFVDSRECYSACDLCHKLARRLQAG